VIDATNQLDGVARPAEARDLSPAGAREPIVSCEQCGMCSSACPITGVDGFNIRRIERAVQLGFMDEVVESGLPWLCTTCGRCEEACPNGYRIMSTTRALRAMMKPEQIPVMAPCKKACPVNCDAPRYTRLIAQGRPDAAYAVIRETLPFAGVLGRVCAHPCEEACKRADVGRAVSICTLKRFAYDEGRDSFTQPSPAPDTGKRVAVVGAGPAGLTAAFHLRKKGHAVTVFEGREVPGGMMRYGIPSYRLPDEVLDREIGDILSLGVDLRCGQTLGEDVTLEALKAEHDAVFLAVGAQVSRKVKLENGDHPDVLWGVEYLADVRAGLPIKLKDRVVVVGGGNVAVDVALTALRTGARSVAMACLESREEMPAFEWEIEEAVEEGVQLLPSWGPSKVLVEEGRVAGVELVQCTSVFDESGAFCPMFGEGSKIVEADQVILAIGQATDLGFLEAGGAIGTMGPFIDVDLETQATSLEGVFAGGDAAAKAPGTPGIIVTAIAAGRRAAAAMDRHLGGDGQIDEVLFEGADHEDYSGERAPGFADLTREQQTLLALEERHAGFAEVGLGFTAEQAMAEASRCFSCDLELELARKGLLSV
jgi:NADPH-dependent glutamate synthase beta subunit-like oxidoreductase